LRRATHVIRGVGVGAVLQQHAQRVGLAAAARLVHRRFASLRAQRR
jgi:hypothetical protein